MEPTKANTVRRSGRKLLLERLEERILLNAATPVATLDLPASDLLNEDLDFAVSFDNTAAPGAGTTGFAPYVDIVLPQEIDANDYSISFLGASVSPVAVATYDGADWILAGEVLAEHPLTGIALDGADALTAAANVGDQLLIVQLPFGSFTADQPVARLEFSGGTLGGAVGVANTIAARGGFAFGCDEFDNPLVDAPIQQGRITADVTPTVIELTKRSDGDEGESVTGPNFARTYTLEIDIATGETVDALALRDVLPASSAYVGNLSFVQGGAPVIVSEPIADTDAPDLLLDYGSVTGVDGADIVVTYQLYLPDVIADNDGNNNDDGAAVNPFVNAAQVDGTYLGNPVNDTDTDPVTGKLIAIQKGVALTTDVEGNGVTPGDTLTYTLNFQISDFVSFSAVTITDVLGNGLEYDDAITPTFTLNENGVTTSGSFGAGNIAETDLGGGLTELVFDFSQELIDRGQDGVLTGDALSAATTGTITFRARILEDYTAPGPGADLSIDINDVLDNNVTISGTTSGGDIESDTSSASVTTEGVNLGKSIFAVDGDTAFDANEGLRAGQDVTYRLRLELPSADIENLVLTDYLPLPVFDATTVTVFDNTYPPPGGTPASGTVQFGPDHNLNDQVFIGGSPNDPPLLSTDAASNTVVFDFGTFDAAPPASTVVIDLLFTATLLDKPFGDGLFLTNQSVSEFGNTGGISVSNSEIVQIQMREPTLTLTKGVVGTDSADAVFDSATGPVTFNGPGAVNPFAGVIDSAGLAATPVDANISDGIDAGDTVTFALVIENTGGAAAFDVLVRDTLPAGFEIPGGGLNLQIRTGDDAATSIGFTAVGAGLFSAVAGDGIRINDDADGILAGASGAAGSNVLVITYELTASADIGPATLHENAAELEEFAAREGGTDFTDGFDENTWRDSATVFTETPEISKSLNDTDRAFTDGSELTIGEVATFDLLITLPEGEIGDLVVTDLLPTGYAFVGGTAQLITSAAGEPAISSDFAGIINLVSAASGGGSGDDIVFTLDDGAAGAVVVAADNVDTNNSFILRFNAVIVDEPGNTGGPPATTLTNQARIDYTDNDGDDNGGVAGPATSITSNTVVTTVVEPVVEIAKDIDLDNVDAGDIVTITLTLTNSGTADAFDVEVLDVVDPAKYTNVVAGAAPAGFVNNTIGNTVRYTAVPGVALEEGGAPVVFTFTAEVRDTIIPGETLVNTSSVTAGNTLPGGGRDVSGDTDADSTDVLLGLSKAIIATSEAHTTGNGTAAVGEILRYRLEIGLPEASASDFKIQDLLPAGLTFIDPDAAGDANVRIAFVSDGGITSGGPLGIADAGAFVNGDETTLASITPTFALADINISSDPDANVDAYTSGADVFFRLGDITNADADANSEFIVIEFNVRVDNVAGNVAGTTLSNSIRALSDDLGANTPLGADSPATDVLVAEPDISVSKIITTAATDAGDTVVYEIEITNGTGANITSGFDINVVDDLDQFDAGTLTLVSAVFNAGASGATLSDDSTAGNIVDMTIDQLDAGESVSITVTASLTANVDAGRTIDNEASVSYTGLPGASGTAANPTGSSLVGAAGAADGERDGSGGVNTYTDADQINFTTPVPQIDKLLVDPGLTTVDIGSIVQYDILVTLPEGRTENLRISDAIPPGLAVINAQLIANAAGSAYLTDDFLGALENAGAAGAVTAQGDGVDLNIDFGDVDLPATAATSGNQFVVRVNTLVLNAPATSGLAGAQTVLTNAADLTYQDPDDGPGDTPLDVSIDDPTDPSLTVVEPELLIDKQVVVGGGGTSGDAGDAVTWTIVIEHSANSTGTAYDLDLSDAFPADFIADAFTASIAAPGDSDALFQLAANSISTIADLDLAVNETLTLVITGTLADTVAPGQTLTNTALLEYSSTDGDVADVLGGAGGPADALDDERVTMIDDDASVDVPTPTFTKRIIASDEAATLDGLGDLTIGETVTYGIEFTLAEGTYTEIIIDDNIPVGLDYVAGSAAVVAPPGYVGTLPGIAVAGGAGDGDDITLTLSAPFEVTGDNDLANNTFTITYDAVVVEAGTNGLAGAQTQLDNVAAVTIDDPDNPGNPIDLEVTGNPGITTDAVIAQVVEPQLTINKTSVVDRADAGDVVTYTITISHTAQSTGAAFDLVITDQLLGVILPAVPPDKLDLVAAPGITTTAGTVVIGGAAPADQEIRVEVDRFDRGDAPIVITYSALLNTNVNALGDAVTNTASLTYDSHGDSPVEQRMAAPVSDDHTILVPLTTPEFDKSVINTSLAHTGTDRLDPALNDVVVGEVITYRLIATFDEGNYPAAVDARVTDQLPDYLSIVGSPRIITGGTDGVGMNVNLDGSAITLLDNVGGDGQNDFSQIDFDLASVNVDPANPALVHDQIWIEFDALVLDVDDGVRNRNGNIITNTAELTFDPNGAPVVTNGSVDVEFVEPQIDVVKTVSDLTPNLGDTITFTITLSHAPGPDMPDGSGMTAYDLVLNDPLAPFLTLIPGSVTVSDAPLGLAATGLSIDSGNGAGDTNITLTADSLELFTAPNGQIVLTYDARVTEDIAAFGTLITNTATVDFDSIPGDDPNQRRDQSMGDATIRVVGPDLDVSKDDGLASANPGDALTYNIAVTNKAAPLGNVANADTADNVEVIDVLPIGVSFVSSPDASFVGFDPLTRELRWLIASLAPGATSNLSVNVTVGDPVQAGIEAIENDIQVSSDDIDPTPDDNMSSDVTAINAAPDLTVTKTDNNTQSAAGDPISYEIVVSNNGNQASSNVLVQDSFAPGQLTDLVASTPAGVSNVQIDAAAGTVIWTIDLLAAGDSITLRLDGRVSDALPAGLEDLVNNVSVSDDGLSGPDANPGDESDTDSNVLLNAQPDYIITKSNATDTLIPGNTTSWTITVTNVGTQAGTGVEVTDSFDTGVLRDVVASDGGIVDIDAGTVRWSIPLLRAGESLGFTLSAGIVSVPPPGQQFNENAAAVTDDGSNGADPTPGNNRVVDRDELRVFVFDALRNDAQAPQSPFEEFFNPDTEPERWLEPLPVDALFTGHAEPNTVLVVTLFDAQGASIGQQVVVTDTGGNWVANFGGTIINSQPHGIAIGQQTSLLVNDSSQGGFNLRTYFAPALHAQLFFSYEISTESVFASQAGNSLDAQQQFNRVPLAIGWDDASSYEFIASSTTTTQHVY